MAYLFLNMSLTKWSKYIVLVLLGFLLLFIAYKINEEYKEEAYVQQHSPQTTMPVVNRRKGWGTVRFPNKIYVRHQGKKYTLTCSNKYFRETIKQDSISVRYDPLRDRAVLADTKVNTPYVLLVLIVSGGLIAISSTIIDLRRQLKNVTT
ncbi:hypothetical protein GCM10028825_55040 [Spirosoma agri]